MTTTKYDRGEPAERWTVAQLVEDAKADAEIQQRIDAFEAEAAYYRSQPQLTGYEEHLRDSEGLGDARRCPRHPHIKTSSDDGMVDGLCDICEGEGELAEAEAEWNALSPEEQAQLLAEAEAAKEAARQAREEAIRRSDAIGF